MRQVVDVPGTYSGERATGARLGYRARKWSVRRREEGGEAWLYWNWPGFEPQRLPGSIKERIGVVKQLNRAAAAHQASAGTHQSRPLLADVLAGTAGGRRAEAALCSSRVYAIQAGDNGPIKVGFTSTAKGPLKRVETLQVGNPVRLRLLATVPGGLEDERYLHKLFAEHRIGGEWFTPAPAILAAVDAMAGFSPLTQPESMY